MKRALGAVGGIMLALAGAGAAHAQKQIEWKQVYNMPKGLNQPKGVSLDILGIELGDTYAEVKAKLTKLLAETAAPPKPQAAPAPSGQISQGQADAARLGALEGLERQQNDIMSGVSNRPPMEERKPAEAPKPEEPKPADAPKSEETKPAEAPKTEEAKPEAPKPQEAPPAEPKPEGQ